MDFNFSSQHHAVIHSENETTAAITFLDNASDDAMRQPNTASASSGKMVELNMERMEAKVRSPTVDAFHADYHDSY
jgi:hypothetical protein